MNPASYFEIPVIQLERAIAFYAAVFGHAFERAEVDGNQMAFFAYREDAPGASGALAQGDSYVPGKAGVRIYLQVADLVATLARAVAAGGAVLYPPTQVGAFGSVAEIEYSQGNCIGLHLPATR